MMKRVSITRIGTVALLLSAQLAFSGLLSPANARVEMSSGQAGDPTDGEGIAETGGSSTDPTSSSDGASATVRRATWIPREVVLYVNGVQVRIDLHLLLSKWKSQ